MPIISGGGGGGGLPLTGGTITGPLVISPTSNTVGDILRIVAPSGYATHSSTGDLIHAVAEDGTDAVEFDAYGNYGLKAPLGQGAASLSIRARDSFQTTGIDSDDGLFPFNGEFGWDVTNSRTVVATSPAASSAPTLALGAAYQNALGYDALLVVYLSVTVNTSGVLKLGVGPTNTPTQQTLVTGLTSTGLWTVPIYLPSAYYALLSTTGTITIAVDGQVAMAI